MASREYQLRNLILSGHCPAANSPVLRSILAQSTHLCRSFEFVCSLAARSHFSRFHDLRVMLLLSMFIEHRCCETPALSRPALRSIFVVSRGCPINCMLGHHKGRTRRINSPCGSACFRDRSCVTFGAQYSSYLSSIPCARLL